ncbi:MAG: vWA domain-containing protein [Desulfitobacteriaceae bacterium]
MTNIGLYDEGVVKRNMNFFWLVDYSGSMEGSKIATLNQAIKQAIPAVSETLKNFPQVNILMSAIKFSTHAEWHVGPDAVPIDDFFWPDLKAEGLTATAEAINLLIERLDIEKMGRRAYPPVCILLSDGYCTNTDEEYDAAIEKLNKLPWGKKAVRLVIAIGNESDYDENQLLKFTNHKEIGILKAHSPEVLVQFIKWASTSASLSSSQTKSKPGEESNEGSTEGGNVVLPDLPDFSIDNATDAF